MAKQQQQKLDKKKPASRKKKDRTWKPIQVPNELEQDLLLAAVKKGYDGIKPYIEAWIPTMIAKPQLVPNKVKK